MRSNRWCGSCKRWTAVPTVSRRDERIRTKERLIRSVAKNIRVHELAKELGMTNAEAVELCVKLGVPVKSHSSSLNEAYADMVRRRADPRRAHPRRAAARSPSRRRRHRPRRRPPRQSGRQRRDRRDRRSAEAAGRHGCHGRRRRCRRPATPEAPCRDRRTGGARCSRRRQPPPRRSSRSQPPNRPPRRRPRHRRRLRHRRSRAAGHADPVPEPSVDRRAAAAVEAEPAACRGRRRTTEPESSSGRRARARPGVRGVGTAGRRHPSAA